MSSTNTIQRAALALAAALLAAACAYVASNAGIASAAHARAHGVNPKSKYLLTSLSQLSPAVRKALAGAARQKLQQLGGLPAGVRGETGAQGPQGPKGETGAQGLEGETGPEGTGMAVREYEGPKGAVSEGSKTTHGRGHGARAPRSA